MAIGVFSKDSKNVVGDSKSFRQLAFGIGNFSCSLSFNGLRSASIPAPWRESHFRVEIMFEM